MEKEQLKEEINKMKNAYQRSEEDKFHMKKMDEEKILYLQNEVDSLRAKNNGLQ